MMGTKNRATKTVHHLVRFVPVIQNPYNQRNEDGFGIPVEENEIDSHQNHSSSTK